MIFNSEVLQNLSQKDKELLVKVMDVCLITQKYVENLKGTKNFPTFECHSTCRAIALHVSELKVVDGHYMGMSKGCQRGGKVHIRLQYCTHSWLTTPSGSIVDPYPVGFLSVNPVLVINRGKYKSFGGNLYKKDERVTEVINTKELHEKVKVLSSVIGEAQKPHQIF